MYELLGICLLLATLMFLNAVASLSAALIWRLLTPLLRSFSARARADILFVLRIAAPVVAAITVVVFVIPSYLSYEPRVTSETVSKKLGAVALLSAISVAFAAWRTIRSWMATAVLRRRWLAESEQIHLPGVTVPTFRIPHPFPIIAIVGTFRPQLFIACEVLSALNQDELAAAIAHECGHLSARDNLKRTLLRICRDTVFLLPLGNPVDRVWADIAESAADEFAAGQSPATALDLASALVRIAKMIPAGPRADVPLGAYLMGAHETQGVKSRIRRLLEISSNGSTVAPGTRLVPVLSATTLFVLGAAAIIAASNARVLMEVHAMVERAVTLLY